MKGNGNGVITIFRKLLFMVLPTNKMRTNYIIRNKKLFKHIGNNLFFQPRQFPADPERIWIGDNVNIASDVIFINHDISYSMLNKMNIKDTSGDTLRFNPIPGCIKIGNNVMIGARTIILPDVEIGDNVIIGAGSIVSRDIPKNTIAAGIPAKQIGTLDSFIKKRIEKDKEFTNNEDELWDRFFKKRN